MTYHSNYPVSSPLTERKSKKALKRHRPFSLSSERISKGALKRLRPSSLFRDKFFSDLESGTEIK
ncbi:hypothetical protein NC653_040177 [Populus alba x Populus x berolinensis]|uniref:Uncharacterized protein n=1 Tax=Populus alba x Populus x berolinensis TaxID=444605 RepID=A0AAD6PRG6_9ROSI|nr:hypothetical protein NC653_040177 [Populus alba x Populus x berolinensis]